MEPPDAANASDTTLDPKDWSRLRAESHALLDIALDFVEQAKSRPVWRPPPEAIKKLAHESEPPSSSLPPEEVSRQLQSIMPYNVGNTHPRFFGWVHGTGSAGALLPEMVAAAMNSNCGGRDHAAIYIEKQVLAWSRSIMRFPPDCGALLVSGTSMATVVALKAARDAHCDFSTRKQGVGAWPKPLVGYCTAGTHSCIKRAFDILGLGSDQLVSVPATPQFQIDLDALKAAVKADRAAGKVQPFVVIGTAGSVNVGAVDDLDALADFCEAEGLWLHVDGAFGAAAMLSQELQPLFKGLERASSLAFDFHKWFHVQYDCGCVLVRDRNAHLKAFSERPDYLAANERGLAAGSPWPVDFGPELSRGFRALKVWAHFLEHGTGKLGAAIYRNVEHAKYLASLVDDAAELERLAPVTLQIVTFRYVPPPPSAAPRGDEGATVPVLSSTELDELNDTLVVELQERGIAAPSTTRIHGQLAIRVNITNHRTRFEDLRYLCSEVRRIGALLVKERASPVNGHGKAANGKRKERD